MSDSCECYKVFGGIFVIFSSNNKFNFIWDTEIFFLLFEVSEDEMVGHVARMGEVRGAYNILVGRPEGRRPLGRHRHRWEDNIKMDLREIWFGDVDWIHWAQDRGRWRAIVNTVMNLRVP
jgi:hypothetical protein